MLVHSRLPHNSIARFPRILEINPGLAFAQHQNVSLTQQQTLSNTAGTYRVITFIATGLNTGVSEVHKA